MAVERFLPSRDPSPAELRARRCSIGALATGIVWSSMADLCRGVR